MADIDLITLAFYYTYQERNLPSPITDKETTFTQLITQASSFLESEAHRPFLTGSAIPVPTDIKGNEISTYDVYADIDAIPYDLKTACSLLVTHFKFEADHYAIGGTSDDDKSKNYNLTHYNRALNILEKYKYHEPLDRTAQRVNGDEPEITR